MAAELTGSIHSIETFGALDGPGLRYVVFMQGCPLRCLYCHNPDSWAFGTGERRTPDELFGDIMRYKSFIANGGATFSGGEPLMQSDFVAAVLARLKAAGLHTAVDTSGAVPLDRCREALDRTDLLILDIKALDDGLFHYIAGAGGNHMKELLDYREREGKPVWIRHVLVPGITMVDFRLKRLADFLQRYTCIEKFEPLGFHKMGEYKWQELNEPYTLADTPAVERDEVDRVRAMFRDRGIPV